MDSRRQGGPCRPLTSSSLNVGITHMTVRMWISDVLSRHEVEASGVHPYV